MKKTLLKKLCVLGMAGMLCISKGTIASAFYNAGNQASVYSDTVTILNVSLSISYYGAANINVGLLTQNGTVGKNLKVILQKKDVSSGSWQNVTSWNKAFQSRSVSFEKYYGLTKRGTYRCYIVLTVVKDGVERQEIYVSDKKTY